MPPKTISLCVVSEYAGLSKTKRHADQQTAQSETKLRDRTGQVSATRAGRLRWPGGGLFDGVVLLLQQSMPKWPEHMLAVFYDVVLLDEAMIRCTIRETWGLKKAAGYKGYAPELINPVLQTAGVLVSTISAANKTGWAAKAGQDHYTRKQKKGVWSNRISNRKMRIMFRPIKSPANCSGKAVMKSLITPQLQLRTGSSDGGDSLKCYEKNVAFFIFCPS